MLPERQQIADKELRLAVLEALAAEARTAPLNLRVGVVNGIVHLAGQAPSKGIWSLAERLAAGIPGVRGVVNRIEAPGAPPPGRTVNLDLSPTKDQDQSINRSSS
jgi:osmotically-inducible protein OsmY